MQRHSLTSALQFLINNAGNRGVTKTVPVFITLAPSELCCCCSHRLSNMKILTSAWTPQGRGSGGAAEERAANLASATLLQLCSGGEFNFLLVFSWWVFQLLKKQSKKTATNKHLNSNICITERRLLRLRKGPGHSPHSCDKGVGEQTGPGALAERMCAMLLPDTKHVCI